MDLPPPESDKPRGLFQCTECKRSYTRVDHLARHVRSHLQEKPFQCDVCHKGFGRPDLLKRHGTCHDTDANAKRQKRTLTQSSRVSQACKSCAYAKLKCEDEKPCKRCQTKGIPCESNSDNKTRSSAPTSQAAEQANSQIPTPNTLLNSFDIGGDDASISGTTFTSSITTDPITLPSSLTLHENNFYDFLRNVITPNNPGSFSPPNWDFEPRNVLDFTVEDDLAFDANDFGLLDAFNGRTFNPNLDFGPLTTTANAAEPNPPAESTPSDPGPAIHRKGAGLGAEAYRKSSFVRWHPAHEGSHLEVGNISVQDDDASSPDARYKLDQRILAERLEQSSRDKLLAIILKTCDATNLGRVVASFPSTDLLDDFLQCFFAKESPRQDSFIHVPTFNPNKIRPELLGAVVAAGAVSTDIKALQKLGHAIMEAIRIALTDAIEKRNATTRELFCLQSFLLIIDVFLWSGNKRKMEIAESQQQPLWTMLRRAGRFKKPRSVPAAPLPDDTGTVLHQKWLAWVEQESIRRLVFRGFLYDAQSSMTLLVNPIISYGELALPFPAKRDLWTAETAEQWKAAYLSQRPDPDTSLLCLLDCLKNPKLLASFPGSIDHDFSALIVLHGIWGMVWEYNQLQLTLKATSGEYHSSLVMQHRHSDLCRTLHALRISASSWPVAPTPLLPLLLDLHLLYLHLSIEDVQLFVGKDDQDEARRVYPALQQWSQDSYARTAVRHAALILRTAAALPMKSLRNFSAIAVYHAALALWTYGVIKQAASAAGSAAPASCTCISSSSAAAPLPSDGSGADAGTVWLDGPETSDVQQFVTLGRGNPAISSSARDPSAPNIKPVPLSDPEAAMGVVVGTLRGNFGAEDEGEEGLLPPLVENLAQLVRGLGEAAGAVGG